jgi:hypothetical protein
MSGASVFLRPDVQQVLSGTLETHHLPGSFVVADAMRAIRFVTCQITRPCTR